MLKEVPSTLPPTLPIPVNLTPGTTLHHAEILRCDLQGPPAAKWERETADTHTASRTWGLRDHMLRQLAQEPSPAMLEINSRLAQMYPDFDIALMPAEHMQHTGVESYSSSLPSQHHHSNADRLQPAAESAGAAIAPDRPQLGGGSDCSVHAKSLTGAAPAVDSGAALNRQHAEQAQQATKGASDSQAAFCAAFVGNAPVHGDTYCYHVDADPAGLPPSRSAMPLHHAYIPPCAMPNRRLGQGPATSCSVLNVLSHDPAPLQFASAVL